MNLESRALNIEVSGREGKETIKVVKIEGHVESVEGKIDHYAKKCLRIHLNRETQKDGIAELNFYGTSPVRGGDKIRVGLILNENVIKYNAAGEALYMEIIDERGHYSRRDFGDEYVMHVFNTELGLEP